MSSKYKVNARNINSVTDLDFSYDVLVIIPTANEFRGIFDEMRNALAAQDFEELKSRERGPVGTKLFAKQIGQGLIFRIAVYCENLKGNMLSAAHTAYLCQRLSPKLVISAGIAGSLDPRKAWIGDIVLPNLVENSTFDKIYQDFEGVPKNSPSVTASNSGVTFESPIRLSARREQSWAGVTTIVGGLKLSALNSSIAYASHDSNSDKRKSQFNELAQAIEQRFNISAKPPEHPRIIENSISFSWDKVLDSRDTYEYLLTSGRISEEAVCVEMESWGFLAATELFRRGEEFDVLIVRGISDIVGCKGITDNKSHNLEGDCRQLAMSNVGRIVCHIVADRCP
ncbi:hypothetical protein M0412_03880 [Agrobacterium sp. O3.4]|uniref:Nucleoside phosphorylase domain-containing protein n=1 Tax=Agrobacterium cucumeris TaxID=2862866 RepID=A0ABY8RGZ5_9HYPH|nr:MULTISPECIES: hypothetical protein [Rhizobium/Agrobacterium group]MCZ7469802.1 hypothetical protein [Rhizobium rhizogenes]WHO06955.1 hypothetical protein KZ699_07455 [Agrobacterium cucumeris]